MKKAEEHGQLPARSRPRTPAEKAAGRPDTTEQKMMSDMPLPMPRLVISSPIHISSAAPAVNVVTMSSTRAGPKFGTRSMLRAGC